jgi:H+-transporting ATPase
VLSVATVLGILGVVSTFLLFWYVDTELGLPRETIQTIVFLKLLVAGHLTVYVTRNPRWFWTRPWPAWKLLLTSEATQVVGTLFAVYGVVVEPIGWTYALAVWAYALAWLPLASLAAVLVRRLVDRQNARDVRHLSRIERLLHRG